MRNSAGSLRMFFCFLLILFIFFSLLTLLPVSAHLSAAEDNVCQDQAETAIINSKTAEKIIKNKAFDVLQAISSKNFNKAADYVHPEKGLRFTPYTHVSVEKDVVFTKEQLRDFFEIDKKYIWGIYDGIGTKIKLTPAEYYDEFIYSEDFINAEEIGYNKTFKTGNTYENQFEVYDNPIIVEYYFSGFKTKFAGMDWKSLSLVFEEYKNDWKLVGIIHNQWTI